MSDVTEKDAILAQAIFDEGTDNICLEKLKKVISEHVTESVKSLTAERDALREQVKDLNQSHVRISIEEYQELKKKDEILERLWTGGVENWGGYDPCVKDIEGIEKYSY